jgi:hypothetical protein
MRSCGLLLESNHSDVTVLQMDDADQSTPQTAHTDVVYCCTTAWRRTLKPNTYQQDATAYLLVH